MRVNHAGEICAQALYHGQSMTARNRGVRDALEHAAAQETEHLAWTGQRIGELGGRVSALNPLLYAGSFAIGAMSGLFGDKWNLGFLAETEKQVEGHLEGHLERLPEDDLKSRAIVEQMKVGRSRARAHRPEPWRCRIAVASPSGHARGVAADDGIHLLGLSVTAPRSRSRE